MTSYIKDLSGCLILRCHFCDYRPWANAQMSAVQKHFDEKHAGEVLKLDLVVICQQCDVMMDIVRTDHISRRQEKDIFHCPQCGQNGYLYRKTDDELGTKDIPS